MYFKVTFKSIISSQNTHSKSIFMIIPSWQFSVNTASEVSHATITLIHGRQVLWLMAGHYDRFKATFSFVLVHFASCKATLTDVKPQRHIRGHCGQICGYYGRNDAKYLGGCWAILLGKGVMLSHLVSPFCRTWGAFENGILLEATLAERGHFGSIWDHFGLVIFTNQINFT